MLCLLLPTHLLGILHHVTKAAMKNWHFEVRLCCTSTGNFVVDVDGVMEIFLQMKDKWPALTPLSHHRLALLVTACLCFHISLRHRFGMPQGNMSLMLLCGHR